MRRLYLLITLACCLCGSTAMAKTLSPEEALAAARQGSGSSMMKAPARAMELALTVDNGTAPTVYVFSTGADTPGFMVVAADDVARPLLGYSDDTNFDPNNIPPQLQWMLDAYSATISALIDDPSKAPTMMLAAPATTGILKVKGESRASISPICQTQWNQADPYWNKTPTIGSKHTYTGCVATAMAQVMKVHQWPTKGTGTHSYTYQYNNRDYSASFDFGSTTFDWSSMLNKYTGTATTAQKNAVATLMSACGVASDMRYGPEGSSGSGTSDNKAGYGLITYFNYDKGLSCERRDWYTAAEWDDLVYGELAAGRPVMYCGQSSGGGHAFVCDGYSSNNYYHINWGWGGTSDGYFLLADLNPYEQGAGGSTSDDGFNADQSILLGVRPAVEGSSYVYDYFCPDMAPGANTYARTGNVQLYTGNVYNYSVSPIPDAQFALKFYDGVDDEISLGTVSETNIFYGFRFPEISGSYFPEGTYKVRLEYKVGNGDWKQVRYDKSESAGYYNFTVTSDKITINLSAPGTEEGGDPTPQPGTISFSYLGFTPAGSACYPGETYSFNYTATATGAVTETYYAVLFEPSAGVLKAASAAKELSFSEATSADYGWNITIPSTLTAGTYAVALATLSGNQYKLVSGTAYQVTVAEKSSEASTVSVELNDVTFNIANNRFQAEQGETYAVEYAFTTDGSLNKTYYLLLLNEAGNSYYQMIDGQVNMAAAGTANFSWDITIPANFTVGTYIFGLFTLDGSSLKAVSGTLYYLDVVEGAPVAPVVIDLNEGARTYSFETTEEFKQWAQIDADGDGYVWDLGNSTDAAHSGSGYVYSASYINNVGALTPDNWLISPQIIVPERGADMEWYLAPQDYSWQAEHFKVLLSPTGGANISDFTTTLAEGTLGGLDSGAWEAGVAKLPQGTVRVAFVHCNCTDFFKLKLDDVTFAPDPASGIGVLHNDGNATDGTYYNLQGIRVNPDRLTPGIYIVKGKKIRVR